MNVTTGRQETLRFHVCSSENVTLSNGRKTSITVCSGGAGISEASSIISHDETLSCLILLSAQTVFLSLRPSPAKK